MPSITALVQTHNDAVRIGRCLEMLYPCDRIVVVDRGSMDATVEVAREYGARIVTESANSTQDCLARARLSIGTETGNWLLCLDPHESLSESLATSLYEWKSFLPGAPAFSVFVREETPSGWITHRSPQTRLVPQDWREWSSLLPTHKASAVALEGDLLRFSLP